MLKTNRIIIFAIAALCCSCNNKKVEDTTIIATETKSTVRTEPIAMGNSETPIEFEWNGDECTSIVTCEADSTLPVIHDDGGNAFFDNRITLTVKSPTKEIFKRSFTKNDFKSYLDSNFLPDSKSCMSGIAFVNVDNGKAKFIASVGSPDPVSDEYMLIEIIMSKDGSISMSKATEDME